MKAKCLNISNPYLIAAILDYTKKFNIRSPVVLEATARHFVQRKGFDDVPPPHVTSMITAFGHLDFDPPLRKRFWKAVESYVNQSFIRFPVTDIVNLLLACVYLEKFPINFVDRIFSPYFLDRIHANANNIE
jgi:hypothetical protein